MLELTLEITIDGTKTNVAEGTTVLDACCSLGIEIPTLCHDNRLKKFGGCRLCLVEIEGQAKPVVSCSTNVVNNMVVSTSSEKLHRQRSMMLEFILSDHPNDCMTCQSAGSCKLQSLAYSFGLSGNRFRGEARKIETKTENPFIIRDYEKCILCGKCIRGCDEIMGIGAIDFAGRGFDAAVSTPFDAPLDCTFCGQCIDLCPVGALREKSAEGKGRNTRPVTTICSYCGVGCGVVLHVENNKLVKVTAAMGNGANNGSLCVKGKFGLEFINSPDRLTTPLVKKNGKLTEVSWDEALEFAANRLMDIKKKHGPETIGGLSSAKCTNEDNYLFQRFIRAGLGSNNVDHCARLCHSPSATGLLMAFGGGAMTNTTDDMMISNTVLIIGSNTSEAHPVAFIKLLKAMRENGTKLIVIDPRKTRAAGYADIWLDLKPGTNTAILNGIMNVIYSEGLHNKEFISQRTEGFELFAETIKQYAPEKVEELSGVSADNIRAAARLFAASKASSIYYGMGVTQHTQGTETVLLLAALSMITGHVGRPGTGVNPLRGQSNVQGACDMGALPNLFPGYGNVADDDARKKFEKVWNAQLNPNPGITSTEMVEAMPSKGIRALYIMGENPMVSDPNLNHAKRCFESLDLLIVQDIFLTETARMADVVFPAVSFAEKTGTLTNTDRKVQILRRAISPPGESRDDSRIIIDLAAKTGYDINLPDAMSVWNEIRSIWPAVAGISYDRIEADGISWPCPDESHPGTTCLYTDRFNRGKGKFYPVDHANPVELTDDEYPLTLSTGRILFHFHTGTMSRQVDTINEHSSEGFANLHTKDAEDYGISNNDMITVTSRRGTINIKASVSSNHRQGMVFIPFHFVEAAANMLTINSMEKYSKIPDFKVSAVKIEKR